MQEIINSITEGKQAFDVFKYDEVAAWQTKLRAEIAKFEGRDRTDAQDLRNALADVERLEAEVLRLNSPGMTIPTPPPANVDTQPAPPSTAESLGGDVS